MGCSRAPVVKNEVRAKLQKREERKRFLPHIKAVEVPRVGKSGKNIIVKIWGHKEVVFCDEEIEIRKIKTGYQIKIWLIKKKKSQSLKNYYKEISLNIKNPGGYDIEVVGKNRSFLDIVYID